MLYRAVICEKVVIDESGNKSSLARYKLSVFSTLKGSSPRALLYMYQIIGVGNEHAELGSDIRSRDHRAHRTVLIQISAHPIPQHVALKGFYYKRVILN